MKIRQITLTPVFIPYDPPVGPYLGRVSQAARNPGATGASSLIARVEADSGLTGWGEGKGKFEVDPQKVIAGRNATDIEGACRVMQEAGVRRGPASAIEMALWDLLGKAAGLPLCSLLGGRVREWVDFCACMGLKQPAQSAATAEEYMGRWGFRFLKTKAGNDAEEDLRIAAAIQRAVGQKAALRPDANGGYSPQQAGGVLARMKDLGIRFFEDPCTAEDAHVLARFRKEIGMGIFVNMGVETSASVPRLLAAEAADFLMPDTPASGGILAVKKVAAVAEAYGVPCLMHCSHDLGIKTAAILHVAGSTPNFSGPNDTCYHGLRDDILTQPLRFENGQVRVPEGPGLGVEVDEHKLVKYRVA